MSGNSLPIDQILTMLAEAPPRIAALTADLTPEQLRAAPAPGEWSAGELLAHLRACADVWGGCIAKNLAQDNPTLRRLSPRTWIRRTDYPKQEFLPSLQLFAAQRTELLAVLRTLSPQDWSRAATVTGAKKPLVRTVHSFAQSLAEHEHPHVEQIARIVNTMQIA